MRLGKRMMKAGGPLRSTSYRVDRVDALRVPCGMNSIVYLGKSPDEAKRAFAAAEPGLTPWGKANDSYGVVLSRYDERAQDYVILDSKGLDG